MAKHRGYTFGITYMQKLQIKYSLIYGFYCQDHYATWLINMGPKDTE